ncbi:MAG: hypothetical protein ABIK12_04915, partial [Pseudomonadota bacterium]
TDDNKMCRTFISVDSPNKGVIGINYSKLEEKQKKPVSVKHPTELKNYNKGFPAEFILPENTMLIAKFLEKNIGQTGETFLPSEFIIDSPISIERGGPGISLPTKKANTMVIKILKLDERAKN